MADRPLILLTNDDGIQAEGLNALKKALMPFTRTVIVAPAMERSASSHSITLQRPLRYKKIDADVFSLDGTPADCVYMALYSDCFLPIRPDLVLAGINHGLNLGTDIFYSGTVGAAREAAIHGVSAMALSYDDTERFEQVADLSARLTLTLLDAVRSSERAALLNVNVPKGSIKGGVTTSLSRRYYQDNVVVRQDPRGHEYLWIGGRAIESSGTKGTDVEAVNQGYFSITALAMEATDTDQLEVAQRVAASCLECSNEALSATDRRKCEG
jgi:5'-nucleotidase